MNGRVTAAAGRARAQALLARWGVMARALRCVSRTDCEVWRVTPAGAPAQPDLALRLYAADRPDAASIDAEVEWLHELAQQGLHVPAPRTHNEGSWRISFDGDGSPRHAVLLSWLPGRMLFAGLRPLHLRRIGALAARLHRSARLRHRAGRWRSDRPVYGPDLEGWAAGRRRVPAWAGRRLARALPRAARHLHDQLATWPQDETHRGWIHGDLHPWNLLFAGDQVGAIDFSDGGWGFLAQDLAAVLQFLRHPLPGLHDHRARYAELRQALLDGYAEVLPLPPTVVTQADALIGLRQLNTLQWILDDWQRPDERRWGPGFIAALPAQLEQLSA